MSGNVAPTSSDDLAAPGPVLYVLKRFPRLSETFVLRELLELEACGERILIDALLPAEEGPRHPELRQVRAAVRYLPRHPRLSHPAVAAIHLRLAVRSPGRWVRLALRASRRGQRRRFVQAGLVAARARDERVRHIHAHFATAAAEVARDAGALARVPVTVTVHAKDVFQHDNAAKLAERLEGVSGVVTVSQFNAQHLRQRLPAVAVHLVPNGIELAPPAPLLAKGAVLCVARLVPKKGVDVLIDALATLAPGFPELRAEVIGDGPLAHELTARAHERDLAGRVRFLGRRPSSEVDAAFARCSIFVLPCRIASDGDRDGMPTVLVEAMARAVPVVSTDVTGIHELVRNGETGLLVPPDDPAALGAAIERLTKDPALARALGERGRRHVAERFDPRRSARLLQDVFAGKRS